MYRQAAVRRAFGGGGAPGGDLIQGQAACLAALQGLAGSTPGAQAGPEGPVSATHSGGGAHTGGPLLPPVLGNVQPVEAAHQFRFACG